MTLTRVLAAFFIVSMTGSTVLAAARTVREPAFGLPHFYGDTDVELARENGREIAMERLGQLILLSRVGRGTLNQVFGLLDPSTLDDDIEARSTAYTSSELNNMFAKLPERSREVILAYCDGVNDTIERIYAGELAEPIEVNAVRALGFEADLFGNATDISDQVDPFYRAPGGADAARPNAGYQFTPEMAMAVGVLEIRNFGLESFDESRRLNELQALIAVHGELTGLQIWDDINFLNDPLAPVTVPDPNTPGYGGAVALRAPSRGSIRYARKFPRRDYDAIVRRREAAAAARAEFASRWGAWPKLGSYAWAISGARSASGHPWIGGFPQTGIQTPSLMHFADNRSGEGIGAVGMEFAGGPFVLIGHTDSVAYTTTTAQLRTAETYFEEIVLENSDRMRHNDEGVPSPLSPRVEIFRGSEDVSRTFWRSRVRNGNGGTRSIIEFAGTTDGTVESATADQLVVADGSFDSRYVDGYVAIVEGVGAGQIRHIAEVIDSDTLGLDEGADWAVVPDSTSQLVAVRGGESLIAIALESPIFLEESTSVLGFSLMQRANDIFGIEAGARLMPSTHNFIAADNRPFNSIGTMSGNGNIGYWSSGFSRVRQDGSDPRLPIDGTEPNPFVVVAGTVSAATVDTLDSGAAFAGRDFSPPPANFRYNNPFEQGSEYIVSILSGAAAKQTRRIVANSDSSLTVGFPWGAVPQPGDTFEIYEIVAAPEAINPSEGYMANWNNKAATADEGLTFGRQFRHIFILERLAADAQWDRAKQRQLNKDLAGLESKGALGRFLVPRLQEAAQVPGPRGTSAVDAIVAELVSHNSGPAKGRLFIDPVFDTTVFGEVEFLNTLSNRLARKIYGDELSSAFSVPSGALGLNIVQHAIDSAAADLPLAYPQSYSGDYFNGRDWKEVVTETLQELADEGGIPDDSERALRRYRHPLAALLSELEFDTTLAGNRGTWEQIIEVAPRVKGEFIFPLGQSGLIEGTLAEVERIDRNFTSLHPIWRDWRFVPMLSVAADLAADDGDADDDGVLDAYERWYFSDLSRGGGDDGDGDMLVLAEEYRRGGNPDAADSDGDGVRDGFDLGLQDRLNAACLADCDASGNVGINDLIVGVNIALGNSAVGACSSMDQDGTGRISIAELVRAVIVALAGCSVGV